MRVLVLTNRYPPDAIGGYELTCRDVVERFAARGHDVRVVAGLPHTWDGVAAPAVGRRAGVERRANRLLAAELAAFRPDVVSVWNMAGLPGTLLGQLERGRPPAVSVVADDWPGRMLTGDPWLAPLRGHRAAGRVIGAAARLPVTLPDMGALGPLCFCSAHLRDRVMAATGWDPAAASVIPWGVATDDFPIQARVPGAWEGRLVFVGRLDPGKGIDTLVRAAAGLDCTLTVIAPPEPHHLERVHGVVEELGIGARVRVASCSRSQLAAEYCAADACVFPSEWEEPFGIVPLEAMACGTPVIATGRGGSAEYLRDGQNCVLFPAGDARALTGAVERLAADAALRQRLVEGGVETARSLTVDRLAERLEAVHGEALRAAASRT